MRGHRSGLLTVADYNNLTQCETLDDIKLNLVRCHGGGGGDGGDGSGGGAVAVALAGMQRAVCCVQRAALAVAQRRRQLRWRQQGPSVVPRHRPTPTPKQTTPQHTNNRQTATDYGPYLANEASPLFTSTIVDRCTRKLVDDWRAMRAQADAKLARFLDFCTYGHMIDNVVLIVTGTLHERDVQVRRRR